MGPWVSQVSWREQRQLSKHGLFIVSEQAKINHEVMLASPWHPEIIKASPGPPAAPSPSFAYRCVVIEQLV